MQSPSSGGELAFTWIGRDGITEILRVVGRQFKLENPRPARKRSRRNRIVSMLVELAVLIATLLGLMMGVCCIYWVKVRPSARHAWWGCRLFIMTLLSLGGLAFFAAIVHADGLAPLGLLSGLLIVGMLWESPTPAVQDDVAPML